MTGVAANTADNASTDLELVENILDDLEIGGDENAEMQAIEEIIEDEPLGELDLGEDVGDDELRSLEISMERDEAYQEQTSELEANAEAAKTAQAERKKNPVKVSRKSAGAKTAGTSRTSRDLNAVPAEMFVLEGDVAAMSDEDKDAAKVATLALMPTQKKIAEKFDNLFCALAAGKQPSVYVVQAFKLLDEKKAISSKDVVASFKGRYSQGTAMSQAGQIMNLFATVKIATRAKSDLTLNENSVMAQRLRDVIAAAKSA
jgi:hypothetical protein